MTFYKSILSLCIGTYYRCLFHNIKDVYIANKTGENPSLLGAQLFACLTNFSV